jgi:Ran-binding protein 9/10
MSRPLRTGSGTGTIELAPDFFTAGVRLSPAAPFAPRIVRGSNVDGPPSPVRLRRASAASAHPHPAHPQRPGPGSARRTSTSSSATAAAAAHPASTNPHSLVPSSIGAGTAAFAPPAYLAHSALYHLLQTELPPARHSSAAPPPSVPAMAAPGPSSSSHAPVATRASNAPGHFNPVWRLHTTRGATPSTATDSDDDAPTTATTTSAEYERKTGPPTPAPALSADPVLRLPTRWSEQDRNPNLSISPDGRDLNFHGEPSDA